MDIAAQENNILILETRALSYSSTHVFLSEIASQLRKMGFTVQHVLVSDIEKESGVLEEFIGMTCTAVIDVNSHLPLANLDGIPYPDLINAPFINILADHPLHLHPILKVKLKNGVLVCLDRFHADYAKMYYPSFKKIINIPFAGTKSEKNISFHDRKHGILFAGTYTPSDYFLEQMDDETRRVALDVKDFLNEHGRDGKILSFPDIFGRLYGIDREVFSFQMYRMRAVERYMRELKREETIEAFLAGGMHLEVMGERWEMFKTKYHNNITIYPALEYRQMIDEMADSRVVINIQPFFADAPHDRISNSAVNGCVCLTDGCEWLDNNFVNGKDYIKYDMTVLNRDIDKLREYLNNVELLEEIAMSSQIKGSNIINWEDYCKKLFDNKNMNRYDK